MSDKNQLLWLIMKNPGLKTAKDYAEELSVTTRTIYRWVEKLQAEGVPVISTTGRSGGISINPDYKPDSSFNEKMALINSTVNRVEKTAEILPATDWIEIEFSDEEKELEVDKKFDICKEAIFTHHVLNFSYHLPQNKMLICSTEAVRIFLHEKEWHLLAWIRQVEKFKVFKLSSMSDLQIGPEKHDRVANFKIQEMLKKQN